MQLMIFYHIKTLVIQIIKVNLFDGIIENWDERQDLNLVPVNIPVEESVLGGAFADFLDEQSGFQFFDNPDSDKRIVIFGHSHEARIITSLNEKQEKNVYVNSGTWIDKNRVYHDICGYYT